MTEPMDTLAESGSVRLSEIEYSGNFTVKYKSKAQLELLQSFFGVRRAKFDMALLDKRPELLETLEGFRYAKTTNS